MNKKWTKKWKIYGSIGLVVATIATTTSVCLSNNANTDNVFNSASNSAVQASENQAQPIAEPKTSVDSDFLLNSSNAISMPGNITALTSTSTTNGPRGFLAQVGGNINYVGYNGKTIWSKSTGGYFATNSYYDTKGYFVCLMGYSDGDSKIHSYKETDGSVVITNWYIPNYKIYTDIEQAKRTLMIPIQGSDSQYLVTYQTANAPGTGSSGRVNRNYWIVRLNNDGSLINIVNSTIEKTSYHGVFLAAGSINYNGNDYLITLTHFIEGNGSIQFELYIKDANNIFIRKSHQQIIDITTYINTINANIINNISELHLSLNASNNIDITAILNFDIEKTRIISNQYNTSTNSFSSNTIINLEQPTNSRLNYDIHKGRIFGDYLYAFLSEAGYNGNRKYNKIMRLKLSDHTDGTWNDTGLQWNGSYTNQRIVLYDYQYASTPENIKVIAQPLYQADNNYSAFPNIFTIYDQSNSLRYLDGTKAAYAYETKTKNNIYDFPISGVANTLVVNASSNLNTYFTSTIFINNFTQYQSGSTYTISKKTGADDIFQNKKGKIPATLVVAKGYNNNSFGWVAKSIDIVLTGFKAEPTNIQATANSINQPNVYPYQFLGNQTTAPVIKDFILNNILTGEVTGITGDNVFLTTSDLNSIDNKAGKLLLNSITLNKWYDENGNVQTSLKTFTLANGVLIEISGFKKVNGSTSLKTQMISVDGELATLTTSQILLPSNKNKLLAWLNAKKDSLLTNLPEEGTIIDLSIESATSSNGQIIISFIINGYYDSDGYYTYTPLNKIFNNITLTGFVVEDLATTIIQPANNVDGQLNSTLPQFTGNNVDFKQFLFDNVVVDPTKQLNVDDITNFNGTYNNTTGTYTLTSITLARRYDKDGNILPANEFSGLNYPIQGFRSIVTTATITASLTITEFSTTSISNATDMMIENWLKTGNNFTQAFVTNSLPDDFNESNIVSVEIIRGSAVPSIGNLKVNIVINNYYEGTIGTLTTTDSSPFELTISGFKTENLATSVNVNPTATTAFPDASSILAESITLASHGFKDYLFNHVLVDPPKTLNSGNIINILNPVANNIAGTLSFNLQVNKRTNVDGNVIDGDFTFTNTITIKGFKQVTATDINLSPINLGDKNIATDVVEPNQLTKTVEDNFLRIFKSLPNKFSSTNIVSVAKVNADKIKGEIRVNIVINLYYAPITGLTTNSPNKTFALTISGYKSSLISIENRYDITSSFSKYANQIAGRVLADAPINGTTDVALMTSWLRTQKVFDEIIPYPNGSVPDEFSVSIINKINNNLGEIAVTLAVANGAFAIGEDQLIFYGFRPAENIGAWIDNIDKTPIMGTATSTSDQIKDIRDQIIKLSQSLNSPFDQALTADEINVVISSNGSYNITIIPTTGYVNAGNYVSPGSSTANFTFTAEYTVNTPTNSQGGLESWVYPVIFSVVGVVALLILLWIIMTIIKRKRNNKDEFDDYGIYL